MNNSPKTANAEDKTKIESEAGPTVVGAASSQNKEPQTEINGNKPGLLKSLLFRFLKTRPDNTLRETIEEFIEVPDDREEQIFSEQERFLLSNILKLRDMNVVNVMVPRADIQAIEVKTTQEELLKFLAEKQYSRIPVYKNTLDEVIGTIHIKDIIAALARGEQVRVKDLLTDTLIVSPSMSILDLMLSMRQNRRHMALVVDEYGGIDGLVTVGDIIEFIVGEIDDEHDTETEPQIVDGHDGSYLVDGRLDIEAFEDRFGNVFSMKEHEESDTLGGLVCYLAGRVPARGEVLNHETNMVFEVLDADPRRVNIVRVRNIPSTEEY